MLIIVFHPSPVLVTVRAKKKKSDQEIITVTLPEFGGLLRDPGYFWAGILGENKKLRLVIIDGRHGMSTPHGVATDSHLRLIYMSSSLV